MRCLSFSIASLVSFIFLLSQQSDFQFNTLYGGYTIQNSHFFFNLNDREVEDFYVLLISLTLSAPQIGVFSHWIQLGNFLVRFFCHISLVLNLIIAFFSFLHLVSKGSLYDYGLVGHSIFFMVFTLVYASQVVLYKSLYSDVCLICMQLAI